MKYLLDTHIVLWLAINSPKLTEKHKKILLDDSNIKYVSFASCWEVAIKVSLNKLDLQGGVNEFFRIIEENGFELLQVTKDYLGTVEKLPFYHRDPFDRMLVATAISDGLTLVTADARIKEYKKQKLKVIT